MYPTRPALEVVSAPFKRSQLGLFHGKMKQYGNNVPFSKKKTRRTWLPNVQNKSLHSDLLNQSFKIKITTRALRTMHKHGGLDDYILKTKPELLGQEGMRIRLMLRDRLAEKATLRAENSEKRQLNRLQTEVAGLLQELRLKEGKVQEERAAQDTQEEVKARAKRDTEAAHREARERRIREQRAAEAKKVAQEEEERTKTALLGELVSGGALRKNPFARFFGRS